MEIVPTKYEFSKKYYQKYDKFIIDHFSRILKFLISSFHCNLFVIFQVK